MRWAGGWEFEPESCGNGGKGSVDCAGDTAAMLPEAGGGLVQGDPIWLWAGDTCSTMGSDQRDWAGRARRQLAAIESFELADELWEGTVTQAEGLTNLYFTKAGASQTVTAAAATPTAALACLENGLANLLHGSQGMIHLTPQLLTHLVGADVLTKAGNLWVTPNGHVVVADAGYTGSGPSSAGPGASQWAYGTPMLQVRLGPIEVIPNSLANASELAQAMDRGINDITVIAGRLAGVQWSTQCALLAAEVNVATCLLAAAS